MEKGFQTLDPHLWAYIATFTTELKDVVTIRGLCQNARKKNTHTPITNM